MNNLSIAVGRDPLEVPPELTSGFTWVEYLEETPSLPDVPLDSSRVIILSKEEDCLAACGISTCFAICFRSVIQNSDKRVLGMALVTPRLFTLEQVLTEVKAEMAALGCEENTIDMYVIGGQTLYSMDEMLALEPTQEGDTLEKRKDRAFAYALELASSIFEQQRMVLELAQRHNIKGVHFDFRGELNCLSIILNKDTILVGPPGYFSIEG